MNSISDTPSPPPPPDPEAPAARRFERSRRERMIGGVCGGLGRYFGIDAMLIRIGFVGLALLGGIGLVVYAAALLLVPVDGDAPPAPQTAQERTIAIGLAVAVGLASVTLGGFGLFAGGALVPIALLGLAALGAYWLVSGRRPGGSPAAVLRSAAAGAGVLCGCAVLAVASFLAGGLGGGVVVATIVVAAGAALVVAAFAGGARWLVLPALAIALPLAFVSAAGIDLDGGFGGKLERPGTIAELDGGYRIGAGELVVDLRDIELPAGDHSMTVGVGAGHALVLVPEDVCVASRADVGIGGVAVFDRISGGIDFEWDDRRRAPAGTARLVIEGDVGLGLIEVRHERGDHVGHPGRFDPGVARERNAACARS